MDKILSSILCCSFGSRPEQKSSTSSTSSSRNTTESNKRADSKKLDQNEEVDEVGNVSIDKMKSNNTQTIILQPAPNNIEHKEQYNEAIATAHDNQTAPVTPTVNNEKYYTSEDEQATKNSNTAVVNSYDNSLQPLTTTESQEDYYEENQFDLTAMQPDQVVSSSGWLLEAPDKAYKNKKCLVLDLDETLVHSSFKYLRSADFVIPVEIEGQVHNVYVIKRPGVDEFMKRVGELYEVVVFTASVSRYGDPLLDELDIHKSVHHRLFRDSCYNYQGNYIKNLSQIGRPLSDLIIIDNSPASYIFHPQHAVPISSWFSDAHDNELLDLLPFLEDLSKKDVDDVSLVLDVTT